MPIYNIFKKITTRKKPKQKTPLIVADIHEKNSLVLSELHKNPHARLEIKSLKIADYLIGNTAIERKTVSDLISSMINKRLIQQLQQMQKYPQKLLIIEGNINEVLEEDTNISKALRGFLLSIITNYQTPIIQTQDYKDTAKYLITYAKQQIKPKTLISFHSKIPKTIKQQKQYVLESFPNIGPKKAELLLKKFKTIKNTINADEEELKDILKSKTKDFKDLLEG
ncbi:MAG: ERCC4 domain-containing protein [archaeon]